jgi:hypothetical protein
MCHCQIIRHGLWFKTIAHGRAYGDGVFFWVAHPILGFIIGDRCLLCEGWIDLDGRLCAGHDQRLAT